MPTATRINTDEAVANALRLATEAAEIQPLTQPESRTGVAELDPSLTPSGSRPTLTPGTGVVPGAPAVPGPGFNAAAAGESHRIAQAIKPEGILAELIVDGSKLSTAAIKNGAIRATLEQPTDLTTASYPLSAKKAVEGVLEAMRAAGGNEQAVGALSVLLQKLPAGFKMTVPWMQFFLADGSRGAQFLPISADQRELSAMLHAPQLMREDGRPRGVVINTKAHFSQMPVNTNDPAFLFADDRAQLVNTHGGMMVPVVEADGKLSMAWPNHPYSYGKMGGRGEYGSLLNFWSLSNMEFGIDPAQKYGAEKWAQIEPSYYEQAHTIGALQVGCVDFSSGDPRSDNTNYSFNITELTDEQKIAEYQKVLGSKENRAEKLSAWTKYCMEAVRDAVEVGANPINEKSVREGRLDAAAYQIFKDMERIFNEAGGQEDPSKGWRALEQAGFIKYSYLETNNCHRVPFKLAHPDADPVSALQPKGMKTEGFGRNTMTRPITLGSLVAGHLQIAFPRERMAQRFSGQLAEAVKACANEEEQKVVLGGAVAFVKGIEASVLKALSNGNPHARLANPIDLSTPEQILKWFGIAQAAMTQKAVVEGASEKVLGAIRFEDMDPASQGVVKELMGQYLATVADFTMTRSQLNKRIGALDNLAATKEVTYPTYTAVSFDENGVPQFVDGGGRKGTLASFTPPHVLAMSYHPAGDAEAGESARPAGNTSTVGWQPLALAIRGEEILDNWKSPIADGVYADKT